MTRRTFPHKSSASLKVLQVLLAGPGTFYQICERAGYDIEPARDERIQREIFAGLLDDGHARLSGLTYSISPSALRRLQPTPVFTGQAATPHFRGPSAAMPVTVVRRPSAEARP